MSFRRCLLGSFLVVAVSTACSSPTAASASDSADLTVTSAGSTTLALRPANAFRLPVDGGGGVFPPPGYEFVEESTTTDEYLRVGEAVTLSLRADTLVGSNATETLLGALHADVDVTFSRGGSVVGTTRVSTGAFGAAATEGARVAETTPFTIPTGVDAVAFLVTEHAPASPTGGATFEGFQLRAVSNAVIGAYTPNKLVLLDTDGGASRQRTLEGGALVAGAQVTFAYTDYRAETLLDASSLDLKVADVRDVIDRSGALGPAHPLLGTADYEVSMSTFDDAHGWSDEIALVKNIGPLLLEPTTNAARFDFTTTFAAPASGSLRTRFHVKEFVVAPSFYSNAADEVHPAGSRTMLRETFDTLADAFPLASN